MPRRVVLLGFVMLAQSLTLWAGAPASAAPPLAFDARDMQGAYAVRLEGSESGQRVAFIGSFVADGAGRLSGQFRVNTGGTIVTRVVEGTYSLFSNGQGTMEWNLLDPGLIPAGTRSFHIVIDGRGTLVEIAEITPGNPAVLTGRATRQ